MIDGGELDEMLDMILRASGSSLRNYTMAKSLGDMRRAVRMVYQAGYNDCAEQFNLGVRIVPEGKVDD
jgi:hypothetical protein